NRKMQMAQLQNKGKGKDAKSEEDIVRDALRQQVTANTSKGINITVGKDDDKQKILSTHRSTRVPNVPAGMKTFNHAYMIAANGKENNRKGSFNNVNAAASADVLVYL